MKGFSLSIDALRAAYRSGSITPQDLVNSLRDKALTLRNENIWIHLLDDNELGPSLERLANQSPESLPLYGVPFAIKDNIDLAAVPTTAACRDYAYRPQRSAAVVERLVRAGAIPLGKTNLDQFATGLVGTRSPYGVTPNAYDPDYIAGGSSSGSAVAVARGLVSFALGTDTAGSGRIPAAFNNLIGLKPSRGLFSTRGVVPACRSLDCVSVFTTSVNDARSLFDLLAAFDPLDPYSRSEQLLIPATAKSTFRFGVPQADHLKFFGNTQYPDLFAQAVERLERRGGECVEVDFTPFVSAAQLLYDGPWVAERYAAIKDFVELHPTALLDVTRTIIGSARELSAVEAFQGEYRRKALRRRAESVLSDLDFVLTPTAGTHYTRAEIERDPVRLNTNLGYYTNFMNLLDLCAISVPAGFTQAGLPFGVTLFADAFADATLLDYAAHFRDEQPATAGPCPGDLLIAVCGAHLSGMPLNGQLIERRAVLVEATTTAAHYRLYALSGGPPARPGLVRETDNGGAIEVEIWAMPESEVGAFLRRIPPPLGIGHIELADGRWVKGFVCEFAATRGATDITALGSWRRYSPRN